MQVPGLAVVQGKHRSRTAGGQQGIDLRCSYRLLSGKDVGASNAPCAQRAEMIAGSQNLCEEPG
jgi:hypothetical protein